MEKAFEAYCDVLYARSGENIEKYDNMYSG